MARKPAPKKSRLSRVVAAVMSTGVLCGFLAGYAYGWFTLPAPVRCEPNPHAAGAMRDGDKIVRFRMEDCEDGTKRMVPDGYLSLRPEGPTPDMERDSDGSEA